MQKLWTFLRNIALPFTILFFLVFIPLYPKIPFFDVVGTWVYIRIEDILVAITALLIGILFITRKESIKTPLTVPILVFWGVGLVSTIIAILFIFPRVANMFPHVAVLHYLRNIEYMILYFPAFIVMKREKRILPILLAFLVLTSIAITVYGLGQKYNGWPAFSTMNEEFAKGVPLRLPPTARIMSTFAGHYDLAAYLVLTIPIIGSAIFGVQAKWKKFILLFTGVGAFILLLLTASRVSFGVYLLTISVMLWWQKKRLLIIPVVIASIIMVNFVSGASDRFLKTLRFNDVVVDLSTGQPIGTLEKVEGGTAVLERISEPDEENLPKGSGFINIPITTTATGSGDIAQIEYIKKKDLEAGKGDVATASGSFLIQKAFVLDISITTRFQGQWPRALQAFKRNIFTGSGYSSLSLAADGNYHRMLGETGILGTLAFLGIFLYAFVWFWKKKNLLEPLEKAFVVGFFAGVVGLCANAVLIDVFVASKVAFPLWLMMGIAMAILSKHPLNMSYGAVLYKFFTNKITIIAYFILGMFLLFGGNIGSYFIGDDFTWLRWAAESNVSDIPKYFTDAQGFFYRPIPKLWYFSLFSVFWLMPTAYHIASICLFAGIALLTLWLQLQLKISKRIAALSTVLFTALAIHHENIFWISGQSSLLAVCFFLLAFNIIIYVNERKKSHWKYFLLPGVLLLLSLFSWETLIVGPIIIAMWSLWKYKQKSALWFLLLLPVYIVLRTASGAVPPSGDYGYDLSRFLVNSVGNGATYLFSILFGPIAMEYAAQLRTQVKDQAGMLSVVGSLICLAGIFMIWKLRKEVAKQQLLVLLALSFALSLVPFLGLGAASERYALLPSVFLVVFGAYLVHVLFQRYSSPILKCIVLIGYIGLLYWNVQQMQIMSNQWKFSSSVTEQTLLSIRKGFFPPTTTKTFVFINTPIRQGRAWIFPIGLHDALWHMFRQSPFYSTQVSNLDDAFAYPHAKDTDKIILQFENFTLQQVTKESE